MVRGLDNSVETVNAAASAIIQAESRVQQVTSPRRRLGGCLNIYWCFGSQKQDRRISHAACVPEAVLPGSDPGSLENPGRPPPLLLPFTAPPSSPASFLQSGPASATLSPTGPLSLSTLAAADACSPGGPASIFAIGPYANETQLVSPPVFSTFTTEPSTAPLTPPPEPMHLTTPPSPEVPFARLLTSLDSTRKKTTEPYEFQSYLLYPGSPIGHLISPSSVCSGDSSPLPAGWEHPAAAGAGAEIPGDHRVSFELTVEEVARCLAKESTVPGRVSSEPAPQENHLRSASRGASRDFKFDNSDGLSEPEEQRKNWAFFPMIQSGAS
ncbi:unnamed protein product [Spirodela intermedia]|uniref:Uncharacterized protein n=2 Tax=Spirodela intermedia TaxID=51605 RepID=A0A7I8JV42_SPIIN|nr:unnamed protein product [Spirodela intermedia]CAA6673332.1 unnamed protein product [Spirodela intermedia]CAA7410560.1 unnamed protein product [Spirodela intermedia]